MIRSIFVRIDNRKLIVENECEPIPAEHLKHIFERFYKGKNSSKDSVGIGLSLAKTIIEKDNGYITVESEIGKSSITKNIKDEDIAELVELLSGFSSRDISKILKETINEQLTYSDSQLSIGDFKKQIDHFIANRDDNLQKSVYKNKLRLLADNLTETEAEEVMNLYIEYKRQQKAKNAEGK